MDDLFDSEAGALRALMALLELRLAGPLTEVEAEALRMTERWLRENTDGMRPPAVAGLGAGP